MSQPLVSVVLPAFKSAGTICRAVDSVMAQTVPAHEIIVVDDGSPDDQAAVVERAYGDRVILIRQANGGVSSARNTGIDRATGDFIAFLDADDYWEPEKLKRQLDVFIQHPEVGLVAGNYFTQQPGSERSIIQVIPRGWTKTMLQTQGQRAFHLGTLISTITVMVRRTALNAERFDTSLKVAEDRDLWIRLVSRIPSFMLDTPLATAVLEPGSLSRGDIALDCTSMLEVVNRHRSLLGPLATREWESQVLHRWAANDENPRESIPRLIASLWLWPLPFFNCPRARWLGRLKRLAVLTLIATGLRSCKFQTLPDPSLTS